MKDFVGLTPMPQQQPKSQMPYRTNANYAISPSQVIFFFSYLFSDVSVCYGVCFLFPGSDVCIISPVGAETTGSSPLQSFGIYILHAYVPPCAGLWSHQGCTK